METTCAAVCVPLDAPVKIFLNAFASHDKEKHQLGYAHVVQSKSQRVHISREYIKLPASIA
jgi:hypothetical protein